MAVSTRKHKHNSHVHKKPHYLMTGNGNFIASSQEMNKNITNYVYKSLTNHWG